MTDDEQRKRSAVERAFKSGVIGVLYTPPTEGVVVPLAFKTLNYAKLNFNHTNGKGDFVIRDDGIAETLRFNGTWQQVFVPWAAIYGVAMESCGASLYFESPRAAIATATEKDLLACTKTPEERRKEFRVLEGGDGVASLDSEYAAWRRREAFQGIKGGKA